MECRGDWEISPSYRVKKSKANQENQENKSISRSLQAAKSNIPRCTGPRIMRTELEQGKIVFSLTGK